MAEGRPWKPSRVAQFPAATVPHKFKVLTQVDDACRACVHDLAPATWHHFRLRARSAAGDVVSDLTSVATKCSVRAPTEQSRI